jgi:UDP-4-amino-4,6-dideoxy-N-acetyl-beta-L-altrosamine transaminase
MKALSYGHQDINQNDIQAVIEVLESDYLTQGPKVEEFEDVLCALMGAKYCVAVSNGTAALHIAVAALGVEKGMEGITSPITFVASANCMLYNEITPIFADINSKSYNIDPTDVSHKLTPDTRLVIPVHMAGQPADMKAIAMIARKNNLHVIEDAAHAIGSQYADGSYVGNCEYSDMTTFSFHPVKTITTGEGGAITTNSETLYRKLLLLRSHGITNDERVLSSNPGPWYYEMHELGFNYRMSDMQAALGISQMSRLIEFKNRRRDIVSYYNSAFAGISWLTPPWEAENLSSCFHLYIIQIDFQAIKRSRKEVMSYLSAKRVGTQVHYIPVNQLPYYSELNTDKTPNAESYYDQCLSIPLYPGMRNSDVDKVIKAIISLDK